MARHILDCVDSTNAHGLRLASSLTEPAWFLAHEQTAGRGRRARPWISPRGNFHGTLVLRPSEATSQVALRSFAAALALREAFVEVTGLPEAFALKWPNDVLLNGGKVAGILLESQSSGEGVAHLAIGFGVNLFASPDASLVEPRAVPPVSLLRETGHRVSPEAFLDHLAPAYARWEAVFQAEGFAPLRQEWLIRAARLGQPIRACVGTQCHEGRFETIDGSGALILVQPGGAIAISAAEVFF